MHTLTDTEYLPVLTAGYSFRIAPRTDEYSGLVIAVYRNPRVGQDATYSHYISIAEDKMLDKATLKGIILANARRVANMPREWNPEFVQNLREIMRELTPPTDDVEPTPRSGVFFD